MPSDSILLVHPDRGMYRRCILPVSLPAVIGRIPFAVRGVYASELSDEQIRRAQLVIVDLHWYVHLAQSRAIAHRVRAINPRATLVTGGLSASLFARELVTEADFDYVVRGDGEGPLPALATALLGGGDAIEDVPNLVGKDGLETPWTYHVTPAVLDTNDYLDLRFFPSAARDIDQFHAENRDWPVAVGPWLLSERGCPFECTSCAGSVSGQAAHFGRGAVVRSPAEVARDLEILDRDPGRRFSLVFVDFLASQGLEYGARALDVSTDLAVQFEFTAPPSRDALDLVFGAFRAGVLVVPVDRLHATSPQPADIETTRRAIQTIRRRAGFRPILAYSGTYLREHRDYRDVVLALRRETGCLVVDVASWWHDAPVPPNADFATYAGEQASTRRYTTLNRMVRLFDLCSSGLPRGWRTGYRRHGVRVVGDVTLARHVRGSR